jgi:hypothetical protein
LTSAIARLLSIVAHSEAVNDLQGLHDLMHLELAYSVRTCSQAMASHHPQPPSHEEESCAERPSSPKDNPPIDLLAPTQSLPQARQGPAPRSPSPGNNSSPRKAPSLGSTPPRTSLGRTPRSSARGHSSPQSPTSPLHDDDSQAPTPNPSQSSINSETDIGALVDMHCGRKDNRFSATIGVRGYASSDETSISGSLYPSSQSATTSQTPSIYSTGSFHPAPIPSNAGRPLCKCRRPMQFGCFTQDNHSCDGPECGTHIQAGAYGWHCEVCSFDFCTACHSPDFAYCSSHTQSTLDSSLSTMQLSSPSPEHSPTTVAPYRQKGADAAAAGRGHDA